MTDQHTDTRRGASTNSESDAESESGGRPFSDMDVVTMRDLLEAHGKLDSSDSDGESA